MSSSSPSSSPSLSSSSSFSSQSQRIKILIANRSEIACRLIRTYSLYPNIQTVALFTPSEKDQTHVRLATSSVELPEEGPRAYLDAADIVNIAKKEKCWGIAPGYGFLSEDAGFVRLCEQQGIVFIGPTSDQLAQLGNKMSARSLAAEVGVPVLVGTKTTRNQGSSIADVLAFAKRLGSAGRRIILKAAAGGGGRGIRIVDDNTDEQAIRQAYEACQREAQASFGDGSLFAERYLQGAKHIEVQLLGDGTGQVCHFWERECSLQRRNQKVVEIAPSPSITPRLRGAIIEAAAKLGKAVKLRSLATIEFLVDAATGDFYFMEANPRIQVEHTITEQINGIDLVGLQLQVALGRTLADMSITQEPPPPRLTSIQLRINAESFTADGSAQPEAGTIRQGYFPTGAGVRVETALEGGRRYAVSPLFDSLLAKLIVTSSSYESALRLARWAIDETRIVGCRTNQAFLMALLDIQAVQEGKSNILTIQENFEALYSATQQFEEVLRAKADHTSEEAAQSMEDAAKVERPEGSEELLAHITGVVLSLKVNEGDKITAGQELVILAAMKMEHSVRSASNGIVVKVAVTTGQQINAGDPLLFITVDGDSSSTNTQDVAETESPEDLRPELKELNERKAFLRYSGRDEDVAKRHANGYLTGRENLDLLVDKDSFIEIGDLVVAAQRKRYPLSHLIVRTSGDGIIVGWAKMENHPIAVVIGDYLVLAGTQGHFHHQKLDRIFQSIINHPAPLVFYTEGGGGRPGDTDHLGMAGLKTPSFALMGEIKARGIPSVAVVNGYCFAGNAAFLGTCDIIIATKGGSKDAPSRKATTIGMGGQAMIEGGGLGRFEHEHIGPFDVHMRSGGIDVLVDTEVEAASLVRKIVALFTNPQLPPAESPYTSDPLRLRTSVPPLSSPRRVYDVRHVINLLLDDDSFIEFCPEWGLSVLTGFGRINGRAIAIIASNSSSPLGGAIDVASGAKVNRLLRLLIRLGGMHLLSLCDTPGFMVGPDFERSTEAQGAGSTYRCFGDWFGNSQEFALHGGRFLGLVLRNGFGLGAQAMLGGGSLNNSMCMAWPNAVFGGMGIEGAVRLAYKKELEAIKDLEKRKQKEQEMIDVMYDEGRALNMAMAAEIDSVIDPATTRKWLEQMMKMLPERVPTYVKARRCAKM